jgi:hypothetical protein
MFSAFIGLRLAVVISVVAAGTVVGSSPAAASLPATREPATSSYDLEPSKEATATCPDGRALLGAGGRIVDGDGGVVLAAVVPDLGTASVTAQGEALPGHLEPWAVVAVAVCGWPPAVQELVRSEPGSSTATCPGVTLPVGTGFELPGPAGEVLLTGLVPSLAEGSVTVRAVRPGAVGDRPVAYAICLAAGAELHTSPPGGFDDSSPKSATVTGTGDPMTGVGGRVEGAVTDVFIDALLPATPDLGSAAVRAVRVRSGAGRLPAGLVAPVGPSDEDWSLIGAGVETHDYY